MSITVLEDNLINKIAAGEVVERPVSVVKELLDNAIDAGASRVRVHVVNGGIDHIEVEDNGQGIAQVELPLAFQRHATSKIKSEADLFAISTMGFRGEALPSIASVAEIEIFTRREGEDGVRARLENGRIVREEPYAGAKGTRIIVSNIFARIPARRKFLKTPVTENNQIYDLLCRYAVAWPAISFALSSDKRVYFKTPGNGQLHDVLLTIYGADFTSGLIAIDYSGQDYRLQGFISRPDRVKSNRSQQIFYVNHRPIRSGLLYKAVDTAYRGLLTSREYPVIFLKIEVPLSQVDVNVHPQKSEVRFADEKMVFKLVNEVLRECLNREVNKISSWDQHYRQPVKNPVSAPRITDISPEKKHSVSANQRFTAPAEQIKAYREVLPLLAGRTEKIQEQAGAYSSKKPDISDKAMPADRPQPDIQVRISGFCKAIGQINRAYIVAEAEDSLWLIDQHAAHERILYNAIKQKAGSEEIQPLLLPQALDLPAKKMQLLEENLKHLTALGFDIELIGEQSVVIRGTSVLAKGQEADLLASILEAAEEQRELNFRDAAWITMACRQAVKAGDILSIAEQNRIIEDLLRTDEPRTCPHGRPTIIELDFSELDRMFKRKK